MPRDPKGKTPRADAIGDQREEPKDALQWRFGLRPGPVCASTSRRPVPAGLFFVETSRYKANLPKKPGANLNG
jgi:hypothetical protein